MIKFHRMNSAEHAKDYYYEKSMIDVPELEKYGKLKWTGQLADELKLRGEVRKEAWHDAIDGKLPGGIVLGKGGDKTRRIGEDIVFEAPKSLSIAAMVAGDHSLIEAHIAAVTASAKYIESLIGARIGHGGKEYEITGSMLAATVNHLVNRENQPHLHTHLVILNATKRSDGKIVSNDMSVGYENTLVIREFYNNILAQELAKRGYDYKVDKYGVPQLTGFSKGHQDFYSARSKEIEDYLEQKGLTRETASKAQKDEANRATRKEKEILTKDHLESYKVVEKDHGFDSAESLRNSKTQPKNIKFYGDTAKNKAREVLKFALSHHTEREFVTKESAVLATALKQAKGRVSLDQIQDMYNEKVKNGDIKVSKIDEKDPRKGIRITTKEAAEFEAAAKRVEKAGRKAVRPIFSDEQVDRILDEKYSHLNSDQRSGFKHIFTTENRIIHISGAAGVGKTTMLSPAVKELIGEEKAKGMVSVVNEAKKEGFEVVGIGPVWSAVDAMAQVDIKSTTLAGFLVQRQDSGFHKNRIYMLDEANLANTKDLSQLIKIVAMQSARLVLIGDIRQLNSVAAGAGLEVLVESGMETSSLRKMQRQSKAEQSVKQAAQESLYDPAQALETLKMAGRVSEVSKDAVAATAVAKAIEYGVGKDTVIATTKHKTIEEITEKFRDYFGLLDKSQLEVPVFKPNQEVSETMKRNTEIMSDFAGSELRITAKYKDLGLETGDVVKLVGADPVTKKLHIRKENGEELHVRHQQFTSFEVGQKEKIEVAVGDQVRAAGNSYYDKKSQYGVMRHTRGEVVAIDEKSKTATVKWHGTDDKPGLTTKIDATKVQELAHGYAQTIASIEGLSIKNVVIVEPSSQRDAYLALTRAKINMHVVTEDIEKAKENSQNLSRKSRAEDLDKTRPEIEKAKEKLYTREPEIKKQRVV